MEIWCCIRNASLKEHSQLDEVAKEFGDECNVVPYKCLRLCMFCRNMYAFYADGKPIVAKSQEEAATKLRNRMREEYSSLENQSIS
ncbi:DUF1450 domain-containing protein [Alicyclobacillus dauci]|uniref:DUF1450 domain-containing protein n=1 Tax=Alicyclobacillus dauci TaxID=1475485 RepID=A0ABY6Z8X7_9BACL|nr:DUF1450 domain-containing protein [Alicyclobacillus dauci]WAH39353.1 DUF1450 domain-containing protein [Alicyclobacillus dauci]